MERAGIICYLLRDHKVLLVHADYGARGMIWGGVSGYVEPTETPLSAAIREVREELGVQLAAEDLQEIGQFDVPPEISFTIFVTRRWSGEPQPQEESINKLKWFAKDDLPLDHMHANMSQWMDKIFS